MGFRLTPDGHLQQIAGSTTYLSTGTSEPGSLSFSPDGQFLLVTERLTNNVDVFHIQSNGTLGPIVVNPSAGPGAFAVSFAPNGTALVVETGPTGGTNASAISSYTVVTNGTITPVSANVPTEGAGPAGWRSLPTVSSCIPRFPRLPPSLVSLSAQPGR